MINGLPSRRLINEKTLQLASQSLTESNKKQYRENISVAGIYRQISDSTTRTLSSNDLGAINITSSAYTLTLAVNTDFAGQTFALQTLSGYITIDAGDEPLTDFDGSEKRTVTPEDGIVVVEITATGLFLIKRKNIFGLLSSIDDSSVTEALDFSLTKESHDGKMIQVDAGIVITMPSASSNGGVRFGCRVHSPYGR